MHKSVRNQHIFLRPLNTALTFSSHISQMLHIGSTVPTSFSCPMNLPSTRWSYRSVDALNSLSNTFLHRVYVSYSGKELVTPCFFWGHAFLPYLDVQDKRPLLWYEQIGTLPFVIAKGIAKVGEGQALFKKTDKKMLLYFIRVHMLKKYKLVIIQSTNLPSRQW